MANMQQIIRQKMVAGFSPGHLEIENESHKHSGPATESHFKLTVVSAKFEGLRPVARHQLVYQTLADELGAGGVHALSMHLYTDAEWAQTDHQVPLSPDCRGGSLAG
ncbi:BolA family protein [Pseudohongiella spirulinae]|uniref:Stress-induced morphogen n=1 Tax=Pseudohongiella spirulinae TaxID=1249552 RepID=A0A0S2KDJ6_9GAMM|nr:BolA/IbaG family iron-sulfur metabolism protein [Pseudohongiella spirulinae]ALO46034.1 Stress-induced morphogen [Pseudohongiella spirulinae]